MKLYIENFKAFSDPVTIDLAPVTLLFGPNSAGKSTVNQALRLFFEILEAGGDTIREPDFTNAPFGGFREFVHGHNLDRTVVIGLKSDYCHFDLSTIKKEYLSMPRSYRFSLADSYRGKKTREEIEKIIQDELDEMEAEKQYHNSQDGFQSWTKGTYELKFYLQWDFTEEKAKVTKTKVKINEQEFASFEHTGNINGVNILHPFLLFNANEEEFVELEIEKSDFGYVPPDDLVGICEQWFENLDKEQQKEVLQEKQNGLNAFMQNSEWGCIPNTKGYTIDLLAENANSLDYYYGEKSERRSILSPTNVKLYPRIMSVFAGVWKTLKEQIRLDYLGPIRSKPPRDFPLMPWRTVEKEGDGQKIWSAMASDSGLRTAVNMELLRLGSRYRLRNRSTKMINSDEIVYLKTLADDGDLEEEFSRHINSIGKSVERLVLEDSQLNIDLAPEDLGEGISQCLPVLGLLHLDKNVDILDYKNILCIEQPELHIHPRMQGGLGDAVLRRKNLGSILVETHSEHLILRILKRIRESSEGLYAGEVLVPQEKDAKDQASFEFAEAAQEESKQPHLRGFKSALDTQPQNIAVYYINQDDKGIFCRRLRIDEDGEFIDPWPDGFFEERLEELF